ncbi:hypothetical protein [Streptococcus pluranimalium]
MRPLKATVWKKGQTVLENLFDFLPKITRGQSALLAPNSSAQVW